MKKTFQSESMTPVEIKGLEERTKLCRGDILTMTTLAASGHPGGSMSSIDILNVIYAYADISPTNAKDSSRDMIIISNGHISPAVYSVLGRNGFFDMDECIAGFRKAGTRFEGHVDVKVPGVEWITGNLGQGLSSAAGIALGQKIKGNGAHTFVIMGDGEQQKGQISETRRFATKYGLDNLTVIVDFNGLQISGAFNDVMAADLRKEYSAAGWDVMEADGHDHNGLYRALRARVKESRGPAVILASTVMGKGVSFMENDPKWHGQPLNEELYARAMEELGVENRLNAFKAKRAATDEQYTPPVTSHPVYNAPVIPEYGVNVSMDNRSAFGEALTLVAKENQGRMAVFDCDLSGSVKTDAFARQYPHMFFQSGIQEHSTASTAAGLSKSDILTYWADFGVFAADEVFNQLRLNEINGTNLKVVATHCGLNVGEDGKTHQAINYVGLMNALFDFKLIVPADPNQTAKAVAFTASDYGNTFIAMGRAKVPVLSDKEGAPLFGDGYSFDYGKIDLIDSGDDVIIFAMGAMVPYAVKAVRLLKDLGIDAALANVSCPLAIDSKEFNRLVADKTLIATYEDHNVKNGLGAVISGMIADSGLSRRTIKFGVEKYARSGKADDVYRLAGLSAESVAEAIAKAMKMDGRN